MKQIKERLNTLFTEIQQIKTRDVDSLLDTMNLYKEAEKEVDKAIILFSEIGEDTEDLEKLKFWVSNAREICKTLLSRQKV